MRSKDIYTALFCIFLLSCETDDHPHSDIPSVVLNGFHAQFPDAREIDFGKRGEHYEVEFELGNRDFGALIDSTGTILKEKREVSWKELPDKLRSWLEKEYRKQRIEDPEVVMAGDQVYYQIQINRFPFGINMVLNRNGKSNSSLDYWD